MRYFRATFNPSSPLLTNGACTLRARFEQNQMIYAVFQDGCWVAVADDDMGEWGSFADFQMSDVGENPSYMIFQEAAPQGEVGAIPVFRDQLVPWDTSPTVQPVVWPFVHS